MYYKYGFHRKCYHQFFCMACSIKTLILKKSVIYVWSPLLGYRKLLFPQAAPSLLFG